LFVGDEGSKQGTAVNGMQVMYAKPKHGDIVNIGASQNPQASIMAIEEETITDFLKATTSHSQQMKRSRRGFLGN
jgi:hypothetical protein